MIEKAKNILLESSSFGRRSFMKLAGLTSLITVLPTFRTREAHATVYSEQELVEIARDILHGGSCKQER